MPNIPGRPGPRPGDLFRQTIGFDTGPSITSIVPNSDRAAGGTAITIYGHGFRYLSNGSAPTVTFGGVAATSVVVVDANTITLVDPSYSGSSGPVDVVITIGSQSYTLPSGFTYYAGSITSVTPASGPVIGATPVIITGINFVTGSTIKFGANAATSVTFIDSQHFSCVTPASTAGSSGFVDVTITEPSAVTVTAYHGYQYILLARGDDIRWMPGVNIHKQLGNRPHTAKWKIDGNGALPLAGESITIMDGATQLFAGSIQHIDQNFEGKPNQIVWDVDAIDYTWILNKYRPFGAFVMIGADEIVRNLVAQFAPLFSVDFVQTNLQKISISFDGTEDFSTCLTKIATMIGGGHWYVDQDMEVHFFHVTPPNIYQPIQLGPGTAMTVAEGAAIPSTTRFTAGYYVFFSTFIYSDGTESAFSPLANAMALQGYNIISFTGIPVGSAVGSLTVTKRRIYTIQSLVGGQEHSVEKCFEIQDNTTTSMTAYNPQGAGASVTVKTWYQMGDNWIVPARPFTAAPAGSVGQLTAAENGSTLGFWPPIPFNYPSTYANAGWTAGALRFRVTNLYQDGTESLGSTPSDIMQSAGNRGITLSNVPVGLSIGSVPVVARLIYAEYSPLLGSKTTPNTWYPDNVMCWGMIPDNSTATINIECGVGNGRQMPGGQVDGPSLEIFDVPDDINDSDSDLLFDTPFRSETDGSQIRNRIFVRGSGSSTTDATQIATPTASVFVIGTAIGATSIGVSDTSVYPSTGGQVIDSSTGIVYKYLGVSVPSGNGTLILSPDTPVTAAIVQGTAIKNFLQVDDIESQNALAIIERDANGNPTDGVHEFTVDDSSLTLPIQLFIRGRAELELFSRPIVTVYYSTRDANSRPGAMVHVNRTAPPLVGDFLIQDVVIDQIHQLHGGGTIITPRYTVQASSVRYDLTDLLLEILATPTYNGDGGVGVKGLVNAAVTAAVAVINPPTASAILQVVVPLSESQIRSLNSSPVTAIAAVAGSIHVPMYWTIEVTKPVAFSGNPTINLQDSAGNNNLAAGITASLSNTQHFYGGGTSTSYTYTTTASQPKGLAVVIKSSADLTLGTGATAQVVITYYTKAAQ